MKNRYKTTSLLMRVLSLYVIFGIAGMPITIGYYIDTETLENNAFTTTSLDFVLEDDGGETINEGLFDKDEIYPPEDDVSATEEVFVVNEGDLDFKYEVTFEDFDGDTELCDELEVVIDQDSAEILDDYLQNTHNYEFEIDSDEDELDIEIYLTNDNEDLQDKSCKFDIEIFGWQTDSNGTSGFTDIESITGNEIETGWWVDPSVEVVVANGGEVYELGEVVTFEWNAESTDSSVSGDMEIDIYLSTDGGGSYPTLIVEDTANTGSYDWTSDVISDELKIRVIGDGCTIGLAGDRIYVMSQSRGKGLKGPCGTTPAETPFFAGSHIVIIVLGAQFL